MDRRQWVVYLTRCSDGSLYCGITNSLKHRLGLHNSGKGAKYTRSRIPVELVASSSVMTKSDALKLEYRVKQVPAHNKIRELKKGAIEMDKKLEKELKAVSKKIMILANDVKRIAAAESKGKKHKAAKKTVAKKQPAPKKAYKQKAADTVLEIIICSQKGIDTASLMKETGFNAKKIQNIIFKLRKQGKIKSERRGIYLA